MCKYLLRLTSADLENETQRSGQTSFFFYYYYLLLGQALERGSENFGRSSARQLAALRRVGAKGAWPRCPAKCGHVEGVSIKQIPHLNHPWTLSLTSNDPVWLLWRLHIIHHVSPTDRKACFSPHFYVPADRQMLEISPLWLLMPVPGDHLVLHVFLTRFQKALRLAGCENPKI